MAALYATDGSDLVKIDTVDGSEMWRISLPGSPADIFATPSFVLVGTMGGDMLSVSSTGVITALGNHSDYVRAVAASNSIKLFGARGGKFYIFDLDGNLVWSRDSGHTEYAGVAIAIDGKSVLAAGFENNDAELFGIETQTLTWNYGSFNSKPRGACVDNVGAFYVTDDSGTIQKLEGGFQTAVGSGGWGQPSEVEFFNGHIFVFNSSAFWEFDKDLNLVRSESSVAWLYIDTNGNLYDCGGPNGAIRKRSNDLTVTEWSTTAGGFGIISGPNGFQAPQQAVSGPIEGQTDGSTLAATVRAYRESSGTLVGEHVLDGTESSYSISTPYDEPHTIVALPPDGSGLAPKILRGVTPVSS